MDVKKFNHILDDVIENIQKTLLKKGHEYAGDADRLWNFKQAALLQSKTPEQALLGMATKHIVSIYDMVNAQRVYTPLQWDEKIGDAINYLILLRALVVDTKRCFKDDIIEPFTNELNDALFNSIFITMDDGTYCHSPNTTKRGPTSDLNYYCFWEDERKKQCDNCQYHVVKA